LQAPLRGKDKVIIHSPHHYECYCLAVIWSALNLRANDKHVAFCKKQPNALKILNAVERLF